MIFHSKFLIFSYEDTRETASKFYVMFDHVLTHDDSSSTHDQKWKEFNATKNLLDNRSENSQIVCALMSSFAFGISSRHSRFFDMFTQPQYSMSDGRFQLLHTFHAYLGKLRRNREVLSRIYR